ncbi:hypothetical protein BKA65DRAFT_195186 [Rhexocercosporidium sp. MPI-PUGE-AT-0058]|nr:hypothetical protein BKA65DRAFT_195186 [Rhexocercosporidium sp. MPI-PUGE-AT-0058]
MYQPLYHATLPTLTAHSNFERETSLSPFPYQPSRHTLRKTPGKHSPQLQDRQASARPFRACSRLFWRRVQFGVTLPRITRRKRQLTVNVAMSEAGKDEAAKPAQAAVKDRMDGIQKSVQRFEIVLKILDGQLSGLGEDIVKQTTERDDAILAHANLYKENDGLYEQMENDRSVYFRSFNSVKEENSELFEDKRCVVWENEALKKKIETLEADRTVLERLQKESMRRMARLSGLRAMRRLILLSLNIYRELSGSSFWGLIRMLLCNTGMRTCLAYVRRASYRGSCVQSLFLELDTFATTLREPCLPSIRALHDKCEKDRVIQSLKGEVEVCKTKVETLRGIEDKYLQENAGLVQEKTALQSRLSELEDRNNALESSNMNAKIRIEQYAELDKEAHRLRTDLVEIQQKTAANEANSRRQLTRTKH